MPAERFFVVPRTERTRTFVSAAFGTPEVPAKSGQKPSRQKLLRNQYISWLGWKDSNFRIRRRCGRAKQALTLKCCANISPIFLAETTGLRLQTERHCRHVDTRLLAHLDP